HENDARLETKRRKVRKGTRSCWECRRRKMKCIFSSSKDTICIRCTRRGIKCVGQEFPEEISTSLDRSLQMGDRVGRVEALVEQLLEKGSDNPDPLGGCIPGKETGKLTHDIPTPISTFMEPSAEQDLAGFEIFHCDSEFQSVRRAHSPSSRYERLSRSLYQSLPSQEDTRRIIKACGNMSTLFYRMQTVPYNDLSRGDPRPLGRLFEKPRPNIHPVLLARYMLHVATFLQNLPPDSHKVLDGLSEPPHDMMKRLADTAISLVTINDDLVGYIEGLECVMIESWYWVNGGNLRKGLIAVRRAMTIAQLMGFHRCESQAQCKILDSGTEAHPQFIWFRIIFLERHLCLMLGLPQATQDHSMVSGTLLEGDTPMGRLERIHCVVASRILERNNSDTSLHTYSLTQEIDGELQRAAACLPYKWWLTANIAAEGKDDPDALFWDMRRLFHQLFHYNLLNQLHLPYMIRSSSDGHQYDYSRITCVNASREVLSRFLTFQKFNRFAFTCKTIDFFCFMAAMTLLLAYLDGHRCLASLVSSQGQQKTSMTENLLAHQRPGDRALVEQIQENMDEKSRLLGDSLSTQSADLLRRLMAIETEAANGISPCAKDLSAQMPVKGLSDDGSNSVHVQIPYYGTINITREGVISKVAHPQSNVEGPNRGTFHEELPVEEHAPRMEATVDLSTNGGYCAAPQTVLQPPGVICETLLEQNEHHILTAGADDWAFQGVDMAFFDSLLRGA
ncbi:hypothetical protein N7510_000947, partial [Penicillium lagena]|uniref:uncharacterized protein n=1 Tax=Penicillium lagena TaxID=94218 RepID=UPI00254099D5